MFGFRPIARSMLIPLLIFVPARTLFGSANIKRQLKLPSNKKMFRTFTKLLHKITPKNPKTIVTEDFMGGGFEFKKNQKKISLLPQTHKIFNVTRPLFTYNPYLESIERAGSYETEIIGGRYESPFAPLMRFFKKIKKYFSKIRSTGSNKIESSKTKSKMNDIISNEYAKEVLKEYKKFQKPSIEKYSKLSIVQQKSSDVTYEVNNEITKRLKKNGVSPKKAKPQDMQKVIDQIEREKKFQKPINDLKEKLKKQKYQELFIKCYKKKKKERKKCQQQIQEMIEDTVANVYNKFKQAMYLANGSLVKKYKILGLSSMCAGHPKHFKEKQNEI